MSPAAVSLDLEAAGIGGPAQTASLAAAWRLTKPFFIQAPNRRPAGGALVLLIGLNLAVIGVGVWLSYWRNQWYSALQAHDWQRFVALLFTYATGPTGFMPGFITLAAAAVLLSVQAVWLRQWLQIAWRAWMTRHLLELWRLARAGRDQSEIDNPDQRIADDIRYFTNDALELALDLFSAIVSAVSYIVILWQLSGTVIIAGLHIPGTMVIAALTYAAAGSWLTHKIGRRLSVLNGRQQKREADFRFRLVSERLEPDTASVDAALSFAPVVANFRSIMNLSRTVRLLTRSYNQVADIFPLIVAAPRFFAGTITLGTLLQIGDSFAQVQDATSWFVNNYTTLADLRATIQRLDGFLSAIEQVE